MHTVIDDMDEFREHLMETATELRCEADKLEMLARDVEDGDVDAEEAGDRYSKVHYYITGER